MKTKLNEGVIIEDGEDIIFVNEQWFLSSLNGSLFLNRNHFEGYWVQALDIIKYRNKFFHVCSKTWCDVDLFYEAAEKASALLEDGIAAWRDIAKKRKADEG